MSLSLLTEITLDESEFQRISELVYEHCGINLHDGKRELVRARLAKRLREGHFPSFSDYIEHVLSDPTGHEWSILIDSLSTNLTKFFREEQHFEYMKHEFLPRLLAAKRSRNQFRIRGWSAGCSSGEEPYSIAITLLEAIAGQGRWDVKLLATDVSTRVLEKARRGVYDEDRIEPIPPQWRSKYLRPMRQGGQALYQVDESLKNIVVPHYLNLTSDWPIKGPIDFVFCRNVMIYFDKPTQARLIQRFYSLLDSGGMLFTGHSESLTGIEHAFQYIQPTIYMKP
jgi:chemotaxis protein methyltransferase CheR